MTKRISLAPKASQDLENLFAYIAEKNPDAALRFFDAVRQTMARLAQTPRMGSSYFVNNSRLDGLQKWAVKGFENYLIFYLSQDNLLTVVRILHASRDLPTILEQEDAQE